MKKQKPHYVNVQDYTYFNFGYDLGKCDECKNEAVTYDDDGRLLCEECLLRHHQNGDYENQYDQDNEDF